MATEPPDTSIPTSPDGPCPAHIRPAAAFVVGYAACELGRYRNRLADNQQDDVVFEHLAFIRDTLDIALRLLAEYFDPSILIEFCQQEAKVLRLLDLQRPIAQLPETYRQRCKLIGQAGQSLVELSSQVFVDVALAQWCQVGLMAAVIRRIAADDPNSQFKEDICLLRHAAQMANASLHSNDLDELLACLEDLEAKAAALEVTAGEMLAGDLGGFADAMLMRMHVSDPAQVVLTINFDRKEVVLHDTTIWFAAFKPMHRRLLYVLARRPNELILRADLLKAIGSDRQPECFPQYVTRLRETLQDAINAHFVKAGVPVGRIPIPASLAYIECQRKGRDESKTPSPYRLRLEPEQVAIIGEPPPEWVQSIEQAGL